MMNLDEHLLLLLAEECNEISQSAIKCIRFTTNHVAEGMSGHSNFSLLQVEYNDMLAIVELLKEESLYLTRVDHLVKDKKERLKKFLQISRDLGTLSE